MSSKNKLPLKMDKSMLSQTNKDLDKLTKMSEENCSLFKFFKINAVIASEKKLIDKCDKFYKKCAQKFNLSEKDEKSDNEIYYKLFVQMFNNYSDKEKLMILKNMPKKIKNELNNYFEKNNIYQSKVKKTTKKNTKK
jgi:hypothetical protein